MNFFRALLAVMSMLFGAASAYAQAVSGQGTWESTLLGRDINLNPVAATSPDAVYLYDTTLNATWLRDANSNAGNGLGGRMDWNTATAWASNLVTGSGAAAISDWRLPTMEANPNPNFSLDGSTAVGYNVPASSSEMASLFFSTLGNKSLLYSNGLGPQTGWGLTNTGNFQNMLSNMYWLSTVYAPDQSRAWVFLTYDTSQYYTDKVALEYAMAVRPGDVLAAVPEPETYAMLLAGLGVIGFVRRRRHSDKSLATKS